MKLFVRTLLLLLASVVTAQAQNFPEDGATYRLLNTFRTGVILTEDYGQSFLFCKSPVENDYSVSLKMETDGIYRIFSPDATYRTKQTTANIFQRQRSPQFSMYPETTDSASSVTI